MKKIDGTIKYINIQNKFNRKGMDYGILYQ